MRSGSNGLAAAKITKDFTLQGIDNVTLAGAPATVFCIRQTVNGAGQFKQVILFSDVAVKSTKSQPL
ncbi:hypothetical protein [Paenibacillus sp. SN-8-1]|uniref:hypothetical protein n=1 Tax=Paenibacillus sp. SN-8-1 TaxID=3435409 RepID=UPI003D9A401F